jgi:hypothetical protein
MTGYYQKLLEGRLFIKNDKEWPKYGIGGLKHRSESSLNELLGLGVGDFCILNGVKIKRVK